MDDDRRISYQSLCPKCKVPATQSYRTGELREKLEEVKLVNHCLCGDGDNEYFYWPASLHEIAKIRNLIGPTS